MQSDWENRRTLRLNKIKQNIFGTISSRHVGRLLARLKLRPHKNHYWLHKKIDEFREQKKFMISAPSIKRLQH